MPTLRLENLADISTECFSLHRGEKHQQGFPISKLVWKNSIFSIYAGANWEATASSSMLAYLCYYWYFCQCQQRAMYQ